MRHLLKLLASDFDSDSIALEVAGDVGLAASGQSTFGIFAFAPKSSMCIRVFARIDTKLANKLLGHKVNKTLVPIAAAKLYVAIGRNCAKIGSTNFHHRAVKGAASEIVDKDLLGLTRVAIGVQVALLEAEGNRRSSWLVDNVPIPRSRRYILHPVSLCGALRQNKRER